MSASLHHDALVARLRADTQLASRVFEVGEVPTTAPEWYLVVDSSLGDWSQVRYTAAKDALLTRHSVHCVGRQVSLVRHGAGRVEAQMKDHRLVISGRNVFRPDPWIARGVNVDRDGLINLPFGTIAFDILSEPA